MENSVNSTINQEEFERLISQASEQYQIYLELNQVTSILGYQAPVVDDYNRDISHPLSIQLKG